MQLESAKRFVEAQFPDRDELPEVSVAMAAATLLLWTALFDGWLPMPAMEGSMVMSDPGVPEAIATHNGVEGVVLYLVTWGVMMSAMMYPAMLPFVRRYVGSMEASPTGKASAAVAFLGTYSLVWTATGVVPLAVDALVDISALVANYGRFVVGGMLVVAGVYQLTAYKREALRTCCAGVCSHVPAFPDAARRGVEHGRRCVRCTWALFALMVVVGSMNFFWMLLLTAVVTLERFADRGGDVAATVGYAAIAGGLVTLLVGVPTF
ncbi:MULTISPECIES: DUF2182 domain-containing protein [Halorussus]|uniref:DUF2182 domain-containing protein n=1 Tax=Halorussus TaxID=1070314 RepID=UPI0020A17C9E|nr:DUF2182 domain-containing protein [Halorussus vallis]USZ74276.1 DUF2182 domain-containing protein [Halorussus vallis]